MYKLFRKFPSHVNSSHCLQPGCNGLFNIQKFGNQGISTHTNFNIIPSAKGSQIQYPSLRKMLTNYKCPLSPFSTRKMTKEQIQQSTYSELVDKIINLYNYKQYKIPSALALLEIHHQYQIFKPGYWVLDVGSGPNWAWTDLAIKLTRSSQHQGDKCNTNIVISNDLKDMPGHKECHTHVTGDFNQEQVRTKIALNLIDRQLDIILIDATPQYSGNQEEDAKYTMQIFIKVMQFASTYLKKGGTIIFKTIQSSMSLQNENQAKFYFNEVHRYKSSSFRINSPSYFYILRGFMITQNLKGVENLLIEYKKAKDQFAKTQVIQKYKEKYNWDPVLLVKNEAKNTVMKMRQAGAKNKEIIKLYENDPYVRIQEIIKLFEVLESKSSSYIQKIKAENKLFNSNNEEIEKLPENQEEFAEILFQNLQKIDDEEKQRKKEIHEKRKNKKNFKKGKNTVKKQQKEKIEARAPLAQDQVYMKSTKINSNTLKQEKRQYQVEDLYGYNPDDPTKSINRSSKKSDGKKNQFESLSQQFVKLASSFPEVEKALGKNNEQIEKQYEQANQFFTNLAKEEMKNNPENQLLKYVKKKKQDPFQEDGQQNQQEDDQEMKPKKKMKQKQKDLKKTSQMSSQFDFDEEENQKRKEKEIEDYLNNRGDIYSRELQNKILQQFNNESKVEYLSSKPRKADRKMNNDQKRASSTKSYFKLKNKNK